MQDSTSMGSAGPVFWIVWCAIILLMVVSMWKVFVKAGKPGWAAIIPIYNIIVLLDIAGKPMWWIILCLIPFVNFIVIILIYVAVAKNFGKGVGFALGLIFLGISLANPAALRSFASWALRAPRSAP